MNALKDFFKLESAGGIVLFLAAVLAVVIVNTPLSPYYDALLTTKLTVELGTFGISKGLVLWINDGLMAIFFFLVGLEIKREVLEGELSSFSQAALPGICAIAGLLLPAAIYAYLNQGDPVGLKGWAIPAATDIAFALGIMMLLGPRVPIALKVFLLAIAIFDDLGAIIIIAAFYTADLSMSALITALVAFAIAVGLNLRGVVRVTPYALLGIVMWIGVLKSGVHATLAGVALGLTIPLKVGDKEGPLKRLEHALHYWVAYLILPVFAFANAGVSFAGMSFETLLEPIPLGIALGLFVGKQFGIFAAAWVTIKLGLARLPEGASWPMVYATALLCGVGFTMSLFIGGLAFDDPENAAGVRLGVIVGSLLSGICGYLLLKTTLPSHDRLASPETPGRPADEPA